MPAPTAVEIPESHHDLLDAPIGTLATVGPDGRPQQTVIWFLAEDGVIRISLNVARQKIKNLRANPAVDLLVVDPENTQRYLEVRGDAEIADDADYAFADRVSAKYGGFDLRQIDGPDGKRVVVTIVPARVNAVDMSA